MSEPRQSDTPDPIRQGRVGEPFAVSQRPTLLPCPRCGNPARDIGEQIATCPFCARRSQLGSKGQKQLEAPTARFPTWKPE